MSAPPLKSGPLTCCTCTTAVVVRVVVHMCCSSMRARPRRMLPRMRRRCHLRTGDAHPAPDLHCCSESLRQLPCSQWCALALRCKILAGLRREQPQLHLLPRAVAYSYVTRTSGRPGISSRATGRWFGRRWRSSTVKRGRCPSVQRLPGRGVALRGGAWSRARGGAARCGRGCWYGAGGTGGMAGVVDLEEQLRKKQLDTMLFPLDTRLAVRDHRPLTGRKCTTPTFRPCLSQVPQAGNLGIPAMVTGSGILLEEGSAVREFPYNTNLEGP